MPSNGDDDRPTKKARTRTSIVTEVKSGEAAEPVVTHVGGFISRKRKEKKAKAKARQM